MVLYNGGKRYNKSIWSSGMIPALGAGGPGFKPRNGPNPFGKFGSLPDWLSRNGAELKSIDLCQDRGSGCVFLSDEPVQAPRV